MKRFSRSIAGSLIAFAVATLILSGHAADESGTSVKEGKIAFALPDMEGKQVSLADERLKNKVLLVDIWGTWCGPCRTAIPHLVKLQEKYRDQGFEVVGVSFEHGETDEQNLKTIKRFIAENNINYTVLYGGKTNEVNDKVSGLVNFQGFPTGIFIDRLGKVRKVDVGFGPGMEKKIENEILTLLSEK